MRVDRKGKGKEKVHEDENVEMIEDDEESCDKGEEETLLDEDGEFHENDEFIDLNIDD